jgi:hypothetical protein
MNRQQQAAIVWSRLPDLNTRPGHKSKKSDRVYTLLTSQLSIWTGFEQEVRQETAPIFGNPINFVPPAPANEHFVVARESGVSARIVENIFQTVGAVLEAQGLDLRFGDSPAGRNVQSNTVPDAMIENLRAPGRALVVGEFKDPWNRVLDATPAHLLAKLLGISILQTVVPRYRC